MFVDEKVVGCPGDIPFVAGIPATNGPCSPKERWAGSAESCSPHLLSVLVSDLASPAVVSPASPAAASEQCVTFWLVFSSGADVQLSSLRVSLGGDIIQAVWVEARGMIWVSAALRCLDKDCSGVDSLPQEELP